MSFQERSQLHFRGVPIDYTFPSFKFCHIVEPVTEASLSLFQVTSCIQDEARVGSVHKLLLRYSVFAFRKWLLRGRLLAKAFE